MLQQALDCPEDTWETICEAEKEQWRRCADVLLDFSKNNETLTK
jgi:hypothetical protein